jgi:hypothetical protein
VVGIETYLLYYVIVRGINEIGLAEIYGITGFAKKKMSSMWKQKY